VIARVVNASKTFRVASRLLPAVMLLLVVLLVLGGCKKKQKPFPPAPQLVSTATTAGAALTSGDAGLMPAQVGTPKVTPVATPPALPSTLPPVADTMSPADRAAFEQTKTTIADLEGMAKRGVLTNPDKPEDGDAATKCGAVESSRPQLEALVDPDAKKLVADSKRLCSLEIPIISADKALKQVTISPSQASRQLMCKFASKDIDKARKEKPSDRRVRDLDARFARACR
jgi:hypothetical protein